MLKYIAFCIASLIFLTPQSLAFAQSPATPSGQVLQVTSLANTRDRLWERITMFFKFSNENKADYQFYLTQKRFGELEYVLDNGKGDMIEETSSRFSTYAGKLTDLVVQNKLTNKRDSVVNLFSTEEGILQENLLKQDANSAFWLLLSHDINYLKIYSGQLNSLH